MKLKTKLNIASYILIILFLAVPILAAIINDMLFKIILIVIGFVLVLVYFVLNAKVRKIEKDEQALEEKEYQEDLKKAYQIIKEKALDNQYFALMNSIINKEVFELNQVFEKYDIELDFDCILEEDFYDLIMENVKNRNHTYFCSLAYDDYKWQLLLEENSEPIILTNESDGEIVNLIIDDIKKFFD